MKTTIIVFVLRGNRRKDEGKKYENGAREMTGTIKSDPGFPRHNHLDL